MAFLKHLALGHGAKITRDENEVRISQSRYDLGDIVGGDRVFPAPDGVRSITSLDESVYPGEVGYFVSLTLWFVEDFSNALVAKKFEVFFVVWVEIVAHENIQPSENARQHRCAAAWRAQHADRSFGRRYLGENDGRGTGD